MYTKIVNSVIDLISKYYGDDYSLDNIKFALELAIRVSDVSWSNKDYSDMFDDVILGLEHPDEYFYEDI